MPLTLFGAGVLWMIWDTLDLLRFRLLLTTDYIELRRVLRSRRLARDDIAVRARLEKGFFAGQAYPKHIVLRPKNTSERPLQVPIIMAVDTPLIAWIGTIPNSDPPVHLKGVFGI